MVRLGFRMKKDLSTCEFKSSVMAQYHNWRKNSSTAAYLTKVVDTFISAFIALFILGTVADLLFGAIPTDTMYNWAIQILRVFTPGGPEDALKIILDAAYAALYSLKKNNPR